MSRAWVGALVLACGLAGAACLAQAQEFPSRAIKIIVPNPPGGAGDISARLVSQKLNEVFHQPVVVENQAGASGSIGMNDAQARRARRLHPRRRAVALADHRSRPEQDVVVRHRQRLHPDHRDRQQSGRSPGQLPGHGPLDGRVHRAGARKARRHLLRQRRHRHRASPLRPGAQQGRRHRDGQRPLPRRCPGVQRSARRPRPDLRSSVWRRRVPHLQSGRVRLLTVFDTKRYAKAPECRRSSEVLPAYHPGRAWVGFLAPRDLPPAITEQLHREIVRILTSPQAAEVLGKSGLEVIANQPSEFAVMIRAGCEDLGRGRGDGGPAETAIKPCRTAGWPSR